MGKKSKIDIKFYDKELWVLKDNIWINYTEMYADKNTIVTMVAKQMGLEGYGKKEEVDQPLDDEEDKVNYTKLAKFAISEAQFHPVKKLSKKVLMTFRNGYLDNKLNFHEGVIPFTTSQIDMDYVEDYEGQYGKHPEMERYLNWFSGNDENKKKSILASGATLLTNRNDGVMTILYSQEGGTGKTQMMSLYKQISKKTVKLISTDTTFNHSGKFSLTGSKNMTGLIGDELPINISKGATDKIKSLIDPGKLYREIEDKGANASETDNLVNMMISTNRISSWYEVDNALKSRVNIISIKPSKEFMYTEDEFQKLRADDSALDYLLSISIKYYREALATGKFRASKFRFDSEDSDWYWQETFTQTHVVWDFLQHEYNGSTLEDMIVLGKIEFVSNSFLRALYDDWKKTINNKIGFVQVKKELVKWGETNNLHFDATARKNDKNRTRGMAIMAMEAAEVMKEEPKEEAPKQPTVEDLEKELFGQIGII